uniref:Uncharacterized protein n=1 Tax=viral metagenome TaxID=1070528 RepID=A0A6C0BQX6_9ZZZZ
MTTSTDYQAAYLLMVLHGKLEPWKQQKIQQSINIMASLEQLTARQGTVQAPAKQTPAKQTPVKQTPAKRKRPVVIVVPPRKIRSLPRHCCSRCGTYNLCTRKNCHRPYSDQIYPDTLGQLLLARLPIIGVTALTLDYILQAYCPLLCPHCSSKR